MSEIKKTKSGLLDYLIKTMNGMALGLFSTLIIGTIIETIGKFLPKGEVYTVLQNVSGLLKTLMGLGIGVGIAFVLKLEGLKLISAACAGVISAYMSGTVGYKIGDPLVTYFVVIGTIELVNLILTKKTPVDIIIVPFITVIIATIITLAINRPVSFVTTGIGQFVEEATNLQPFLMGIVISVVMGMALTAPISSAAIAFAIALGGSTGGISGGAAVVGCSVQMIGFAVMSRKDNNIGTVISVGIGTSMLQFKNIMRKPIIWLPTIIVSAILGPIATLVFGTLASKVGAGMGTSGLVGPIDTLTQMNGSTMGWLSVILLMFVLPIILVWIIDEIFRKKGWIVKGDLKI